MDHVAIMHPKLGIIDKIISGEKTIESRWLKNRSAPWNKVTVGDSIYFKDSGGPVRAVAKVTQVLHFSLSPEICKEIIELYGRSGLINLRDSDPNSDYYRSKKYCVLVFLKDPQSVSPFSINKSGFGSGAAWLTTNSINRIML